ncbi:MAG: hypothetical protein KA166_05795, partial [Saprospiraceae bacterium]|nr:hypothetical protein [Saprospiraceae bacterium]
MLFLFMALTSTAQPWMNAPYLKIRRSADSLKLTNFYEIQKAFNRYERKQLRSGKYKDDILTEKDEGKFAGYSQYKRWEWHMEPRVYPSGDLTLPSTTYREFENYLSSSYAPSRNNSSIPTANWVALGPTGT